MHTTTDPALAGRLFREMFDQAPIGTALTAIDGSWLKVNQALATLLGFSVEALERRLFMSLSHPDDLARLRAAILALLEGQSDGGLECRLCGCDGHYVPTLVTPWPQAPGRGQSFLLSVVDLRPIKQAHDALLASETRYRRLFETAMDGILILDADTSTVVDANPFMTELTGFTRDELLGSKIWDIGPFKDRAASKESFAELQKQNYVRYDDLPLRTRDGRVAEVEFVRNVYSVDGARVIQCNIRDITERRRAEHAARIRDRAMAAVSQGILIADATLPHNPLIYVSPGFTQITGYAPEDALGRSCSFLRGPQTDPAASETIRSAVREGRGCTVELLNYRKDGTPSGTASP